MLLERRGKIKLNYAEFFQCLFVSQKATKNWCEKIDRAMHNSIGTIFIYTAIMKR